MKIFMDCRTFQIRLGQIETQLDKTRIDSFETIWD